MQVLIAGAAVLALLVSDGNEKAKGCLDLLDVFQVEYADQPQISPDGRWIVYERHWMDIMTDRNRSMLWLVGADGSRHEPLTPRSWDARQPRWSPDGTRVAFIGRTGEEKPQLYVLWLESGRMAALTQLTQSPDHLSWSPDGRWIAFTAPVPAEEPPLVKLPKPPEGARWAPQPKIIRRMLYRHDGQGYLPDAYHQLMVVPAEGGTPRALTHGPFHHRSQPVWTPDSQMLIFSANRHPDWERQPLNSELYEVSLQGGLPRALTDRDGPDHSPAISPDGRWLAWLGFDDRLQGYQVTRLYVMDRRSGQQRVLTDSLDRDVRAPQFSADGRSIYFLMDDHGRTYVARIPTQGGPVEKIASDVGGTTLGRPYASGSFSVGPAGEVAFTWTSPEHPADPALASGEQVKPLARLNEDLFSHRRLATLEEITVPSSFDGRPIQAWVLKPPGFQTSRRYPTILEIHGGPFANYGPRFSMEMQWYASRGYLVVYANPRGSTSYGQEFGNLIHHNYPGHDYDDLMSVVDAVIQRGWADPQQLFVTGGSGGGVLTAWIIGKTDRFRAAVVAKPVINWYSFVLTADAYNFFYKYWFPGFPWEHPDHYLKRSPISLAGHVRTPTMLLTGEADYRTPISETEQYFQALQLCGVESVLVRVPDASHGIANRPSHLMAKVALILEWFDRHRPGD